MRKVSSSGNSSFVTALALIALFLFVINFLTFASGLSGRGDTALGEQRTPEVVVAPPAPPAPLRASKTRQAAVRRQIEAAQREMESARREMDRARRTMERAINGPSQTSFPSRAPLPPRAW